MSTDSLAAAAERLAACVQSMQEPAAPSGPAAGLDLPALHDNVLKVGAALAQASRSFHFVSSPPAKAEDVASCVRDLEKAAMSYTFWAASFLGATSAAVRRLAAPPCTSVVKLVARIVDKVAAADSQSGHTLVASDVGRLEKAVEQLGALALRPADAAVATLAQNRRLVEDVMAELQASAHASHHAVCRVARGRRRRVHVLAPQASAVEAREGEGEGEEGDGMEVDDDDERELLADPALSTPLLRLAGCAAELLELGEQCMARARGGGALDAAAERAAGVLVTIAKAVSAQLDSLVVAAHDDDADGVREYAESFAKLLAKLHGQAGACLRAEAAAAGDGGEMGMHQARMDRLHAEVKSSLAAILAATSAPPSAAADGVAEALGRATVS